VTRERVSAVAVGTHGTGRLRGILLGSTATELIHKASCSVLIARAGVSSPPATVVVGVDGSPESRQALQVARHLSTRFGARLWPVVAHGGHGVDVEAVTEVLAGEWFEQLQDEPVTALVAAGGDADLIVVGSRGLHGLRALGSVSEQVAHEASCSVLVVR
jgi:nucleotide-binding universal stress UspA family protein